MRVSSFKENCDCSGKCLRSVRLSVEPSAHELVADGTELRTPHLPCRIPSVTLAWIVLGFVLVVAFVLWRLLMTAARWGREMIELQEHGIEVTGVVLKKVTYRARGGHSRYLRYEYVD